MRVKVAICLIATLRAVAAVAQEPSEILIRRLPPMPGNIDYYDAQFSESDANIRIDLAVSYFQITPHEYGPPGYVRRPYDTGPELPVLLPERSVYRASHATVISSSKSGNSNKTHLSWSGRVHLDGIFDFDPIGSNAEFVTATIPVPQERGGNVDFSARASRIDFKAQSDSRVGPITSFMQLDFFDRDTQGPTGSFRPRLRFFYADVGNFRFGQDASVFMDYGAYPNVIENEGPASIILVRQSLARTTIPLGDHWKLAMAAEQPFSDIVVPEDAAGDPIGKRLQDVPDLTGHINYQGDYGHVQTAGIYRRITYQNAAQNNLRTTGYGINFTGDLHLWAWLAGAGLHSETCKSPLVKSRFLGQYAAGYGIARYIEDANGLGLDAALDSSGNFDALFARAWYVGYEHWWTTRWTSTFVFGEDGNSATDALPGNTYVGASYLATNLIWHYADNAWVGLEYLWGQRRDLNGDSADAHRIQFGARYMF